MGIGEIIGIAGIIISIIIAVITYYSGKRDGIKQERERITHEQNMEEERQCQELKAKLVDEYVNMVRSNRNSGIYALAELGLDLLGSDKIIREAIKEMEARTKKDPWSGQEAHIENVDLVKFFQYVRSNHINFANKTVEKVSEEVQTAGESKQEMPN